jgi:hypothetical protein
MSATIDLSKAHLVRQHGDLVAVYSWFNDERALFLVPRYRKGAPWYVVAESAAYRYDDPQYLARQCAVAAEVLGIEPSTRNWSRIATIINEGLGDLVRMPSAPGADDEEGASFGEVFLRADGEKIAAREVRRPKQEGVTYG